MKKRTGKSGAGMWRKNAVAYIVSQGITLLGSSIVQMAIIWQVAMKTSSGFWVTLLTLSSMVPQTILSFFGGVWADRYSRKKIIILADGGIAVITLILALVFMFGITENILPLLVLASALRSLGTGIQTPAVNAVIPQIVPQEHLMRYNGINSGMMSIVQFAAPAAAGLLLSFSSFYTVLFLDVLTAVLGILLLLMVRVPRKQDRAYEQEGRFFKEMKAGVAYAGKNRSIRRVLCIFGAFILLSIPSGFLAVLMVERSFGDNYIYLTVSEMAGFAGMVLSGILLGVWGGLKNRNKMLALGLLCYGVFSLAVGFSGVFWLFSAFMFLMSFSITVVQSSATTILQESVPEEKQGRIFGLFGAMYSGFMPIGMAVFGPLADVFKIQYMIIVCGCLIVVVSFHMLRMAGKKQS